MPEPAFACRLPRDKTGRQAGVNGGLGERAGERKALKAAEAKLEEMKAFLDSAPRRQGKLTKTAEAVVSGNSITAESADVRVVGVFALEPGFASAEEWEAGCRERLGGLLRYYHRDAA